MEIKDKQEKLKKLIAESRKKFGDVILDRESVKQCDVISTGSLAVDVATGIGGIPRGRVTEISGMESSGKTTLCLQVAAQAQKMGELVAYIDCEHALDGRYASNLGVDLDTIVLAQPETAEQIIAMLIDFCNSSLFGAIFVDSVAAMIPRAVLEGEVEDKHMALLARMMSQNLPKIFTAAARSNTAMIFVNQMRSTMGTSGPYGPTTTTTGGNALKFACSMRLQTAKSSKQKDGDMIIGNEVKVNVIKNKLAPPFTVAETSIKFGEGYDLNSEILDFGVKLNMIEKSGSWYSYNGERLGQGRDAVFQLFENSPEIKSDLHSKIRAMYNIP